MQRLAEEFHKLLVAGSTPAPATNNSMPMRTKYEDNVMDGGRFMRKQFLQTLITLRDGKTVPEGQLSEKLINVLLAYGAVTCIDADGIKSYRVVSRDAYKEFIYDIGLLPELLEHDLAEAEYYGD